MKFPFHHKSKWTILLSPKVERVSPKDLRKLGNFKEILDVLGIDGKVHTRPSKRQVVTIVPETCEKSAVKHGVGNLFS